MTQMTASADPDRAPVADAPAPQMDDLAEGADARQLADHPLEAPVADGAGGARPEPAGYAFRPATPADLPTCAGIWREAINAYLRPLNLTEIPDDLGPILRLYSHLQATDPETFVIAETTSSGGEAAIDAFAAVVVRERLRFLSMLFVLPRAQGRGLGRALLDATMRGGEAAGNEDAAPGWRARRACGCGPSTSSWMRRRSPRPTRPSSSTTAGARSPPSSSSAARPDSRRSASVSIQATNLFDRSHRLCALPGVSKRSSRLLGPLEGLTDDA